MTYLLGSVVSRSANLYSVEAIEVSRCPLSIVLICCSYPDMSKKIVVRMKFYIAVLSLRHFIIIFSICNVEISDEFFSLQSPFSTATSKASSWTCLLPDLLMILFLETSIITIPIFFGVAVFISSFCFV